MRPLAVAIVGFGPKGLYAFERLVAHAAHAAQSRRGGRSIEVTIFEPCLHPGAGPNYDPSLPDYLRMNIEVEKVDMWPREGIQPILDGMPFSEWSGSRRREDSGLDNPAMFPPRAEVGSYLSEGFEQLIGHLPRGMTASIQQNRVTGAIRNGENWWLETDREIEPIGSYGPFDECLLATGHDQRNPVPDAPAGSSVAMRGFALTFIDDALALTEGRGGKFVAFDAGRLRYIGGPDSVARIVPFSRTGRPMQVKPHSRLAATLVGGIAERNLGPARAAIAALDDPALFASQLEEIVVAYACGLLASPGIGSRADSSEVWHWTRHGHAPNSPSGDNMVTAREEISASLDVALGCRQPGAAWAVGEAWRNLYSAIVDRLAPGPGQMIPDEQGWQKFLRLAARLERLGFGPPPVNAAKILALVDAGIVDLGFLRGAPVASTSGEGLAIQSGPKRTEVDLLIDAVLPGPGVGAPDALYTSLIRSGDLRLRLGRRGVEVTADARCVGIDGRPTAGLAAIGRPAEDWVVGNDTLFRDLHPHADLWAAGVVDRHLASGRFESVLAAPQHVGAAT